jgi:SAM-dependent methyltransferase
VNVGAGTGSYEAAGREVLAIEPSPVMVAQRPSGSAPVARGVAAALPLADDSVDAGCAFLTVHHWPDPRAGVRELVRVARERVVLLTFDVPVLARFWLFSDYLPELQTPHRSFPSIAELTAWLPGSQVVTVPLSRTCTDGFAAAYWCRPEAFFDPAVQAAGSAWHSMSAATAAAGLSRLRTDLDDGVWAARYASTAPTFDGGLRLVIGPV